MLAYRSVLLSALAAWTAVAVAQDNFANQLMLAPGKSITFVDHSGLGAHVVVSAPADGFLDLSGSIAAGKKGGIYSVMSASQVNEANSAEVGPNGALILRATGAPPTVPVNLAPSPGQITLGGGFATIDQGRVVINANIVSVQPAVSPAAVGNPFVTSTLTANKKPVAPTVAPASPSLPKGSSVNVIQPNGSLPATGQVTAIGGTIVSTGQAFSVVPSGTVSLSTNGSAVSVGGLATATAEGSATFQVNSNGVPVLTSGTAIVQQMPDGGFNIIAGPTLQNGGAKITTTVGQAPTGNIGVLTTAGAMAVNQGLTLSGTTSKSVSPSIPGNSSGAAPAGGFPGIFGRTLFPR